MTMDQAEIEKIQKEVDHLNALRNSGCHCAQICETGHVISAKAEPGLEGRLVYCHKCGAQTFVRCQHCGAFIVGSRRHARFKPAYTAPSFCHFCSAPYPWTSTELKGPKQSADADRQYMELAFQEAKNSKNEDERAHPKVGTVVVLDGAILATAYRGEMGPGHHAEFGALEKKLGQEVLTGVTVYTTLEPCTSRQHPKVGCAQRLLERGVRRVVIGMHDPNPIISGKGFILLRSAKIVIELFPDDLMGMIEETNRDFTRTYSSSGQVVPTVRPSAREPWVKLENRLVDLEPLYDTSGQYSQYSSFRVEEVTDCDVKLQKESNSQTVFLPLSCLSSPWRADSYGGMRAKIERGKLSFDSDAKRWIYAP